jgi:hypothetical protein
MTMTIDELLTNADRYLVKMGQEEEDDFYAIDTWANAAQACSTQVLATIAAQLARTAGLDTAIRGE